MGKGSDRRSTMGSSRLSGSTGLSSMPRHRRNARRPSRPNWSTSCPSCRAATLPMACSPKRCRPSRTSPGTGSQSTAYGARKPGTSAGTTVTSALPTLAATKAGNLPFATPIRASRSFGTAPSSAFSNCASPPCSFSRPSSRTYTTPGGTASTRSLIAARPSTIWRNILQSWRASASGRARSALACRCGMTIQATRITPHPLIVHRPSWENRGGIIMPQMFSMSNRLRRRKLRRTYCAVRRVD